MQAILPKHIETRWKRLGKNMAGLLSLPSWAFLVAAILFWNQIGKDNFLIYFWVAAGVCWLCSSMAYLLFVRLNGDSDAAKMGGFWLRCSGLPIALIPLLVGFNFVYEILYVLSHLAGMHDSL